jgi:hypothetical protein
LRHPLDVSAELEAMRSKAIREFIHQLAERMPVPTEEFGLIGAPVVYTEGAALY